MQPRVASMQLLKFGLTFIQIVMPLHLEKVRDKLAENIHELWGMNKIELGWTYGKVRNKKTVVALLCILS